MEDLKLLNLICRLTKKDAMIRLPDSILKYKAPQKVSISALLFRNGVCKQCGRSCRVGFNLYYTDNEYFGLWGELKNKLEPLKILVNEKEKYLWTYKNPTNTLECDFLEYKNNLACCTIHELNPIHCALPLVQIDQKKNQTILTKRQYGRNYRFGCPVKFSKFDLKVFKEWDLPQLKRLLEASKYLEVDTHLVEIINILEDISTSKREIPSKNIIIYEK